MTYHPVLQLLLWQLLILEISSLSVATDGMCTIFWHANAALSSAFESVKWQVTHGLDKSLRWWHPLTSRKSWGHWWHVESPIQSKKEKIFFIRYVCVFHGICFLFYKSHFENILYTPLKLTVRTWKWAGSQKERIVFQPWILWCNSLVSGRVALYIACLCHLNCSLYQFSDSTELEFSQTSTIQWLLQARKINLILDSWQTFSLKSVRI